MAESASQRQPRPPYVPDLSGTNVGRFAILALLGRGGMGEVYRAYDTKLKRPVALKRITRTADERYRRRLWAEAQYASRLSDARIAGVYDVLEEEGELFLVMEYVEGETLRRRFAEPMPIAEFLDIAVQCAEALAVAHGCGVLHRDIKPENIMLTPTKGAKILDFGVAARLPSSTVTSTQIDDRGDSAELSGTLAYMAPEVLEERESDQRSDIFSLGVVFYEALAGRHPFLAKGFLATCTRILKEDPAPLRGFNPRISPEFERIVSKMLAKNPAERYASAADLLVDLRALRRTQTLQASFTTPTLTPTPAASETPPRSEKKRRVLLTGALIVAAACAVAALVYPRFARPVLAAHEGMLITDFENHSGEALFDDTVSESLRNAMQQSRYVYVLPRAQAVEAARRTGRTDVTHLNADLGRQICQRENCRVVLAGEINRASAGYEIDVKVIDPWKGVAVLADSASLRSPSELYEAVDGLGKRLRNHLGESLAQIEKQSTPLAQVTTPSLEALQRYSAAVQRYTAGDIEGFLALAKNAVEIDPDFAMAHLYLARAYEQLGNEKASRGQLALARQGIDRVSERERYLIVAADYAAQSLEEKSLEQYRLLTELYPDDLEGNQGLATQSIWVGRPEDAIAVEKHILQLDPHSAIDHQRLILWLDHVNNFADALAAYSAARTGGVRAPVLHWGAGLAHLGLDDPEGARREFSLLAQEGGEYEKDLASLYSARVLMYEGRLREATEALRSGLLLDEKLHRGTGTPPVRRYLLGEVLLARGQVAAARSDTRRLIAATTDGGDPSDEELRRAGLQAIAQGELPAARQLLNQLAKLNDAQDSGYTHSCYYNLEGAVEMADGKTEAAEESQRRAAVFYPSFRAYYAEGEAYAARHEWAKAAGAYQHYLEFKGEVIGDGAPADWVLGNLRLARILAQSGDAKRSLQYYDQFLRLWANADRDLKVLREARTERARIAQAISVGPPPGGPPSSQ